MAWLWAALLPHPPIIVPEIGCGRQDNAEATIRGIHTMMDKLRDIPSQMPDRILILSPHQPYAFGQLFANTASHMTGSFARFNAGNVQCSIHHSPAVFANLLTYLEEYLPIVSQAVEDLTPDHGSMVPLYFLEKNWGKLPEVYCMNPIGLTLKQAEELGRALALYDDGARWGFVASGDLSHRLTPDAPGGFDPAGALFDKTVLTALMKGSTQPLLDFPHAERQAAGECGGCSVMALLGLIGGAVEILSYEGPFGVGYCTALALYDEQVRADSLAEEQKNMALQLPKLARLGIKSFLLGEPVHAADWQRIMRTMSRKAQRLLEKPAACFVTVKDGHGHLRGCIGTIKPTQGTLREEILENAVSAASRDPRFPPLTHEEYSNIVVSVDVLGEPELVESVEALDAQRYGVIAIKGDRRGLLLPALEGVDTVEKQVSIAAQKGGIHSLDGATLMRFTVDRYGEKA